MDAIGGWGSTGVLASKSQGYDSAAHLLVMGCFDDTLTELKTALDDQDRQGIAEQMAKVPSPMALTTGS